MIRTVNANGQAITYTLIQTERSSIQIKALPDEVRVFAPRHMPLRQADDFVRRNAEWLNRARASLDAYRARETNRYPMTDGMLFPLEGRQITLRVRRSVSEEAHLLGDELIVRTRDISPDAVRTQLRDFLIGLASERIVQRVRHYAPLIGRSPGRISVREQRTKWGSCSSQGNLNFNWKLIMAPGEALDYVVIHELCHLFEFNHSDRFWRRVARFQPDYAVWRDFLRSGWTHPFQ